jgi:hypothetical protein
MNMFIQMKKPRREAHRKAISQETLSRRGRMDAGRQEETELV